MTVPSAGHGKGIQQKAEACLRDSVAAAGGGGKRARNRGQGLRRQTDHMGLGDDGKACRIESQETEKPLEVLSRGTARSGSPFNFKLGTLSEFKLLSFPRKRSMLHTKSPFHVTTGTHQHSRLPRTPFHPPASLHIWHPMSGP